MAFVDLLKILSGVDKKEVVVDEILNKIFAFHGPFSGGKSTLVVNMGVILSQEYDKKVLIIDTNMKQPYIRTLLNVTSTKCLLDVYKTNELNSLISDTDFFKLSLVDIKDNSIIAMLSPKDNTSILEVFINSIIDDFDYILIDVADELTAISAKSLIMSDILIQVVENSAKYSVFMDNYEQYLKIIGIPELKNRNIVFNKLTKTDVDISLYKDKNIICSLPYSAKIPDLEYAKQLIVNNIGINKTDKQIRAGLAELAYFIVKGGSYAEIRNNKGTKEHKQSETE